MACTKAHALTAGTNAEAEKLAENYEDARRYINRDIVAADLAVDSVDFPEIVRGEYSDITGLHQFTFGFGDERLEPEHYPKPSLRTPNLSESLSASLLDVLLLVMFNVLFVISSYAAFLKYDVR